ncbi:MAG: SCP2 sterol-binding domain-containing protein [bacterium]|nr:SCP2 sterol-binding domain-containing protein [bacterium]
MKFSFLLYMLNKKLKGTAKKNESFKERLKEKDFTLLIKTEDGKRARYYTFNNGELISKSTDFPGASVSLIWADSATGFKTMSSGSNKATMQALQDGKLKIEGDAQLALWFTETVKQMMKAK